MVLAGLEAWKCLPFTLGLSFLSLRHEKERAARASWTSCLGSDVAWAPSLSGKIPDVWPRPLTREGRREAPLLVGVSRSSKAPAGLSLCLGSSQRPAQTWRPHPASLPRHALCTCRLRIPRRPTWLLPRVPARAGATVAGLDATAASLCCWGSVPIPELVVFGGV